MKLRATALGAVLALGIAGSAVAQDKPVHLKMGHWVPPAHPLQKAMEEWGKSVEKASKGTITFQVYPAQQLGKAPDHYDMARDGIADVTYINPGYQPGRFPIIAAGELPFLMKNGTGGSVALDRWYRKYAASEMKDVKFCLAFVHDPGALHAKKKIETPDQIKGMKIRSAHATMASFVTLLGGTNVQASAPESREVLERGVADAITFPWGSILLFKIDSVTKFHMDVPLYNTTFAWVMNKAKYDGMSAAQKKVIDDHCSPEWAEKVATPWAKYEADGRDKLRSAAGHTVYKITDAQVAQWRKAAEPVATFWAENIKKANAGDPDAMLKALKDELKKANANY
jgi:TRAP-type C4-dicarboxylate transport system substrate-binding protein